MGIMNVFIEIIADLFKKSAQKRKNYVNLETIFEQPTSFNI
jgi:hypothetical protein